MAKERPMAEGWLCPVCGQVWAPYVPSCTCKGKSIVTSGANLTVWPECQHDFRPSDTSVAGSICRKCGKWEPPPMKPQTSVGSRPRDES